MINTINVHGGDYEHVLALSGVWNGIDIRYLIGRPNDIFVNMLNDRAYEVCEFSLSNYLMLKDRGAKWLHAIPIFPYRAFRHSTLYVRKDSSLREPADLHGKRIGVPDFSMTAAVWTRGILADQYGVNWSNLHWVVSGQQRFPDWHGVLIEQTTDNLEVELIMGRIDVLLTPATADDSKPASERKLRTLISDVEETETRYFQDFGVYPINHVVVVRDDALARLPGLPRALFDAYAEAKACAYRRQLGTTLMPWGAFYWRRVFAQFNGDPLPYGLNERNRRVIGQLAKYLLDQRLMATEPDIDALFVNPERDIADGRQSSPSRF